MLHRFATWLLALGLASPALASDHIDGVPSLERHEQVDLTDLYLFSSPGDPARLSVVLNLYPGVGDHGHFSSKVGYRLKVRALSLGDGVGFVVDDADEVEVVCRFTDPDHRSGGSGEGSCVLSRDGAPAATLSGPVGSVLSLDEGAAFFGPRADPFFLSVGVFQEVADRKGFTRQEPGSARNLLGRTNVLTIALSLDTALLFPGEDAPMIGVVAESFTTDGAEVLDRLGRGEVTNLGLHSHGDAEPLKQSYNALPGLQAPSPEHRAALEARIQDNVRAYDLYDGQQDWPPGDLSALTGLLLDDFLVIDLDPGCDSSGTQLFAIERALLTGRSPTSCGGRPLTDDLFATMYALFIGGPDALISDFETGASAPYQDSRASLSADFPYLDAPHRTGFPRVSFSRILLNTVLKKNQD